MLLSVDFFLCQHSEKSFEGDEDLILFDFGMFFELYDFDLRNDFPSIVVNCCVEKRKSGVRMQMSAFSLS